MFALCETSPFSDSPSCNLGESQAWFLTFYFGGLESSRKNESWFPIKTKVVWVPRIYGT